MKNEKSFFLLFGPFLTFASGFGTAAISFYVAIVKMEQAINRKATHAEKAPTFPRHPGELRAQHLTFFKSSIAVNLRGISDERVHAGSRRAYRKHPLPRALVLFAFGKPLETPS